MLIMRWLGEIAGFPADAVHIAGEVPFMRSTDTGKAAGKIDMVVALPEGDALRWHGLEVQAVYFSGDSMESEFAALRDDTAEPLPYPSGIRRPDWRSSGAKRLMPQLEIKGPTLRRWGAKLAVAVDRPFFAAIGGPSPVPCKDLNEGDIIWLVTRIDAQWGLARDHWEVLTLEDSNKRLQAATTVSREDFEETLRSKLSPLDPTQTQ